MNQCCLGNLTQYWYLLLMDLKPTLVNLSGKHVYCARENVWIYSSHHFHLEESSWDF